MALITCGECGGRVSERAASCPHCGAPQSADTQPLDTTSQTATPSKKPKRMVWLWVPLGLFAAFVTFGVISGNSPEGQERAQQRAAIERCWDEQGRKSNSSAQGQFIAGACEIMESEFRRRHGREP